MNVCLKIGNQGLQLTPAHFHSHLEGTTTFFSANPADYCVRSDQATEQVVGPESFTMNVVPDASEYYKTDMKRLDLQIPEAELVPVKKYEDEVFKAVADGCELATWDIIDEGYDDDYKGWYDPLGCGICNQVSCEQDSRVGLILLGVYSMGFYISLICSIAAGWVVLAQVVIHR